MILYHTMLYYATLYHYTLTCWPYYHLLLSNLTLTYSFTHLLTYLLTHLLTYLLTYSLTYLLTHSLTHSLTHLLTHSLIYSRTYSHTYLLTYNLTLWLLYLLPLFNLTGFIEINTPKLIAGEKAWTKEMHTDFTNHNLQWYLVIGSYVAMMEYSVYDSE